MPGFDVKVPTSVRVWNYWVGGKDNFAADRELGERTLQAYPNLIYSVRANRAFLARSVRFLVAEAGIRQFLDIGTGIPANNNTHQVAQRIVPDSRIVYVDNDPIVLSHARALLTSSRDGATAYIDADLRDPATILTEAARTLDFAQPVAVVLVGILFLISDDEDPYGIVAHLMDAVPSGSYLVITHPASDVNSEVVAEGARRYNQSVATRQTRRSFTEVTRFFEGLDVVEPGLVQCHRWHPEPGIDVREYEVSAWAAVARKR